ncbi:hypothetical protein AMS68_006996 [Peltaster fructicola]|uniref:Uncharacterized protein n=1 Tax=Peltaster fructicola TaxID=286661 RepID=A0A6H0Y3Q4_9PEZI|nr:hypothetical protein AMS68_006996 [Peltaster fructicola]
MAEDSPPVAYEDLASLEDEFDDVDTQIMRTQYELQKPLYAKRKETLAKIPNFWPLVFEQAPPEIDQYIQTEDSRVFADSLESIEVIRSELEKDGKNGSPRSLRIAFNFKANDQFEDTQLVKDFHWRRASDGWTGLVSEPVRVQWKSGNDLSHGLTEMAYKLFEARKKGGDMTNRKLPEYNKLKKEIESWNARNTSFFTWFAWVSDRRYVSAEESAKANKEFDELKEKRKNGEKVDMPEPNEEDIGANDDSEVEAMEDGEDLAISIADELWPNAIKYFTQAQELDDMSEMDFEEDDEDDEDTPVDIRSLVQRDDGPPSKKQKK